MRLSARPDRACPAHLWAALGYSPNHWSYFAVHTSGARFNAYATSRQCGKTTTLEHDLFDGLTEAPRADDQTHQRSAEGKMIRPNPNVVGVISDTYEHAELSVMPFVADATRLFGDSFFTVNMNKHVLRVLSTGAELRWFSAENPRAAQGHTFSRVYLDEAQNVSDEFWTNLRPALGARMAQVFAFGTPDPVMDSSWFEGLYLRGLDEDAPDYYAYSIPCTLNRWLPLQDVADAAATMSEREFRMKYMGEWVKDDGVVFRDSDRLFTGGYTLPVRGASYVMGLDLAKHDDYTVAYVYDVKGRSVAARMRINHLDYEKVADNVADLYHRYHVKRIKMDTTGLGDPVADMLRKRNLGVSDYTFTSKTKERLVSTLAREVEHGRLVLPKEDTQLKRELKAFSRRVSKAGNVQYSAPVNFNDDCVMALGLAVLGAGNVGTARISQYATVR